jgi:hypothetical protein
MRCPNLHSARIRLSLVLRGKGPNFRASGASPVKWYYGGWALVSLLVEWLMWVCSRRLGRKPWPVYPEPMTVTPVGAIFLLGGVFVEPRLWPHHGCMSLGENLDP